MRRRFRSRSSAAVVRESDASRRALAAPLQCTRAVSEAPSEPTSFPFSLSLPPAGCAVMSFCNHLLPDGDHASADDGERMRRSLGGVVCDGLESGALALPDVAAFVARLGGAGSL